MSSFGTLLLSGTVADYVCFLGLKRPIFWPVSATLDLERTQILDIETEMEVRL